MGKNHGKKLERTEFASFDRSMALLRAEQAKEKLEKKKKLEANKKNKKK